MDGWLKTGLYYASTGQPIFVVASEAVAQDEIVFLRTFNALAKNIRESQHELDRITCEAVQSYFALGGTECRLLVVAKDKSLALETVIEGSDHGLRDKTGLHKLKEFDSLFDLVVFPQLSHCLSPEKSLSLLRSSIRIVPEISFVLVDLPRSLGDFSREEWCRALLHERVILLEPHLVVDKSFLCAPSVAVAAMIQETDRNFSIAESPANRPFKAPITFADEPQRLARINTIRQRQNGEYVLWGHAMSGSQMNIPVARTLMSINDALKRTLDRFVMEPKSAATCGDIQSLLGRSFRNFEDMRVIQKDQTHIECRLIEQGIDVGVEFTIDSTRQYLGLQLGEHE